MPPTIDFRILSECSQEIFAYDWRYASANNPKPFSDWAYSLQQADADSISLNSMAYGLRLAERLDSLGVRHTLLYLAVEQPPFFVWTAVQLVPLDITTFQSQLLMTDETINRVNKATSYVVNYCLPIIWTA